MNIVFNIFYLLDHCVPWDPHYYLARSSESLGLDKKSVENVWTNFKRNKRKYINQHGQARKWIN